MMMCPCRVMDCNKTIFTTLVRDVDSGRGAVLHIEQGKYGNLLLYFLLGFGYEFKLLLNNKIYFKKRTEDLYLSYSPIMYFHTLKIYSFLSKT